MTEMLPPLVLEMRSRFGSVITDLAAVDSAVSKTEKAAGSSTTSMERSFNRAAAAGKVLTVGIVGAGVVIGGVAVKMASDFQSHMTLLQTAAGETGAGVKVVSNGILNLAGATGTSLTQLSEGAYTIEKAGYKGAAAVNVLKAASEGAKAENVDLATATNALTSVMMSYHDKASQAVQVENELVAASGKSKTTMAEFAGSLSTVIPVASAAGISFAQVGGAIATLTQHGTSAQEATQELSNTIRGLQAPNQVAMKAMQQLGLNVVDVESHLGQRGLTGTIDMITKAITSKMGPSGQVIVDAMKKSQSATQDLQSELGAMPPRLQEMSKSFADGTMSYKSYYTAAKALGGQQYEMAKGFITTMGAAKGFNNLLTSGSPAAQTFAGYLKQVMGGATGMNTALMLGGANMKYFTTATREIGAAAGKSGKDISTWGMTQKTLNVQIDQMRNSVDAALVRLGSGLIPIVSAAVAGLAGFASMLAQNPPLLMTLAAVVGAVVVPMITAYIAKLMIAGVQTTVQFAKMIASAVAWSVVNGAAFVRAAAAGAVWIGQMVAQNAAMIAQKAIMIGGAVAMGIATAAQWAWNVAMDANPIGLIIIAIAALIAIVILLVTHWSQVTQFIQQAWTNVCNWFVSIGKAIATWWNGFWRGLMEWVIKTFHVQQIIDAFQMVHDWFVSIGTSIGNWWNGFWGGLVSGVRSIFMGVANWMAQNVFNPIIGMINGVAATLQPVFSMLKGLTGGAVNINVPTIQPFKSFDVGGVIPGAKGAPLPILAHGGEVVLSHAMLQGQQPVPAEAQHLVGRGTGTTINNYISTQTNATAPQIASAVGWELRRRG